MTAALILGQAALSAVLLAGHRLPAAPRERFVRAVGGLGILSGLAIFFLRADLPVWRGMELSPDAAVVAGIAVACTWGLVTALDLGSDRWWAGALAGVATCGLLGLAASRWTIPGLLFLGCASAATAVAASRASRSGWLVLAAADAVLVAVLIADVVDRGQWAFPETISSGFLVPLLVSAALRSGLIVRVGALQMLSRPVAVMIPVGVTVGLLSVSRWVDRPLAIAATAVLALGLGVVVWSILRRRIEPAVVGVWPVALGGSLLLVSDEATVPASITVLLGMTMVGLWPDALERGRLSRGLLLSGMAPTIAFGAIGIGARDSFTHATEGGDAIEVAAWIAVSALLPVAFATGVALGVFVARTAATGGYHPEAVFMTWILTASAVLVGFVLGPGEIFGALGGSAAAILFGVSAALGAFAAIRVDVSGVARVEPSARVELTAPIHLGTWASVIALGLGVAAALAIAWITIEGLKVGFL